ncbi:MAG: chorismate-binding protein [Vicinamibacterales bacterium]
MSHNFTACIQIDRERWLAFANPALVLQADSPESVRRTLVDVEQLTRDRSLHAVGFLAYEAAASFGLPVPRFDSRLPLAWFGLFDASNIAEVGPPTRAGEYSVGELTPSLDRRAFDAAFDRIKQHLADGDSYQVNFTFQMRAAFQGDPRSLFADLCRAQRGDYSALIDLGDYVICSASPELFFEFEGMDVVARPMKGTARRGLTLEADRAVGEALVASPKERAENVMVVDMVRNDLGRVADVGTVSVPRLFTARRYPNVWQMTSEVRARTAAPLDEVVAALHPSASVTGAPKKRTMELLNDLESEPRGIYTGAIGHVPPDGLARFNVAIRTALIDRREGLVTFGVGSGVVWDSDAGAEYAECLVKGSILEARPEPFALLETLRWIPEDGYYLLHRHVDRVVGAAEYFDIPLVISAVQNALTDAVVGAAWPLRVRVLVGQDGHVTVESTPLVLSAERLRVCLAENAVDVSSPFLYHKTTNRSAYEKARASAPDHDDVLLWNDRGEVTEATTANLVVEIDGVRVTPPVSSGLLAGTYRAEMLAEGMISEQAVTLDEVKRAPRLWLINSVHGMREAELDSRTS